MKVVAYHRVSSEQQHLDRGIKTINDFCKKEGIKLYKNKVYTDKCSGKEFDNRLTYQIIKNEVLEPGDILLISELDRLGRTKEATLKELRYFKQNNIRLMVIELPTTCIDMNAYDNSLCSLMLDTINNILIEIYASLSEAEMIKRATRQRQGIDAMKAKGEEEWSRYGRPRVLDQAKFEERYKEVLAGNIKPTLLMRELKLHKSTYYRYKKVADRKYQNTKKIN